MGKGGKAVWCEFSKSPVIIVRAVMQENAGTSMRMLWRLEENSAIESIHSPNARTHCSLCKTTPLQNTSLSSIRLDLDGKIRREKRKGDLKTSERRATILHAVTNFTCMPSAKQKAPGTRNQTAALGRISGARGSQASSRPSRG